MQGAGSVSAEFSIPPITIASDPGVDALRNEVNPRNEQQPSEQFPTWQRKPDARPGVCSGVHTAGRVHGLHEARGFFVIDLWKASDNRCVMQVEGFDSAPRVHAANARYARTAEIAAAIVKDG